MAFRSAVQRIVQTKQRVSLKSAFGLQLHQNYSSLRPKVLIPTNLDNIAEEILKKNQFEVIVDGDKGIGLVDEHPDANYVIVRSEELNKSVLEKMKKLQLVVRAGAGYNTIDTDYARKVGIDVMNTPGANANAVAEEVVAMMLATYRHVVPADQSTRNGKWEKKKFMGRELYKKTIAIAGLGSIGRLVAERLSGFECRLIGYDPLISEIKAKELNIELIYDLKRLASEADIITFHIPETKETRGIVNEDILNSMKDGSCIINAARSAIIDEDALRKAKKKKNMKFCTDVYPKDAPGPKPVADIADIMLPHLGANTYEANRNAAQRAAQQIVGHRKGIKTFVVNRNTPEGFNENFQKLAFYLSKMCMALGSSEKMHPETIKSFFYGDLQQYSDYLLAPIVMGVGGDHFDPSFTQENAKVYLNQRGIGLKNSCKVDLSKGYGDSITVEMTFGRIAAGKRISVRGQITDNIPMVSRLDQFTNLYFDIRGHNTFIKYHDQPGMLARISNIVAGYDVNIEDIRCPHHEDSGHSLAVIRTNVQVSQSCISQLKDCNGVIKTGQATISYPKKN